jgi:hypothetical protein
MRLPIAVAAWFVLAMDAGAAAAQSGELTAEQRAGAVRRVIQVRRDQLRDSTRLAPCRLVPLVGPAEVEALAGEGLAWSLADRPCEPHPRELPWIHWFEIEGIARRADGLFELAAAAGSSCVYARRETYVLESRPNGWVVVEIRMLDWTADSCIPRLPHLPQR